MFFFNRYNVLISTPKIEVDKSLKGQIHDHSDGQKIFVSSVSKDNPTIRCVNQRGHFSIKQQDWFSTLGIKLT